MTEASPITSDFVDDPRDIPRNICPAVAVQVHRQLVKVHILQGDVLVTSGHRSSFLRQG